LSRDEACAPKFQKAKWWLVLAVIRLIYPDFGRIQLLSWKCHHCTDLPMKDRHNVCVHSLTMCAISVLSSLKQYKLAEILRTINCLSLLSQSLTWLFMRFPTKALERNATHMPDRNDSNCPVTTIFRKPGPGCAFSGAP
jgi:hypothetical protein